MKDEPLIDLGSPEREEEYVEAPSHISTTAGGDGLEFDSRVMTVYDEIKAIKANASTVVKAPLIKRVTRNDDEGLTLDQVSSAKLSPLSVLMEAIENLSKFKEEVATANLA